MVPWRLHRAAPRREAAHAEPQLSPAPHAKARYPRLVLVFLAAAACGGGGTEPAGVSGSYVLTALNASGLPYDHLQGCCTYLSGTLELGGGAYSISMTARDRLSSQTFTAREWGKFAQDPNGMTFASDSFAVQPFHLGTAVVVLTGLAVSFGDTGPTSPNRIGAIFTRNP